MQIDLDEPYWTIATASKEVRDEFWKRARKIIIGIENELWRKKVLELGKEKFVQNRLNLYTQLNENELSEMRERLDIMYDRVETEENERTTKKTIHDGREH